MVQLRILSLKKQENKLPEEETKTQLINQTRTN